MYHLRDTSFRTESYPSVFAVLLFGDGVSHAQSSCLSLLSAEIPCVCHHTPLSLSCPPPGSLPLPCFALHPRLWDPYSMLFHLQFCRTSLSLIRNVPFISENLSRVRGFSQLRLRAALVLAHTHRNHHQHSFFLTGSEGW